MVTIGSIIAAITAVFIGLPKIMELLNQWFTKSTEQKVEDAKKDVDSEIADFQNIKPRGRPKSG